MPRKDVIYNEEDKSFVFECPHCDVLIQVLESETACCIFRHAAFKSDGGQIGPHTGKAECDRLVESGEVVGCALPFRFFKDDPPYVEECGYI